MKIESRNPELAQPLDQRQYQSLEVSPLFLFVDLGGKLGSLLGTLGYLKMHSGGGML